MPFTPKASGLPSHLGLPPMGTKLESTKDFASSHSLLCFGNVRLTRLASSYMYCTDFTLDFFLQMTSKVVQQGRLLGSSDVCPIALSSGPANTSPLRTPGKEPSAGPLPNSPPEVTSVHLTETVCTNNNANPLLHATNLRKHNKRAPLAPTRASSSAEHHGKKILPINMVASTECSGPAAQQLSTTEPAERLGPILFAIGIDGSSEGDLATLTNNKVIEEQVRSFEHWKSCIY